MQFLNTVRHHLLRGTGYQQEVGQNGSKHDSHWSWWDFCLCLERRALQFWVFPGHIGMCTNRRKRTTAEEGIGDGRSSDSAVFRVYATITFAAL